MNTEKEIQELAEAINDLRNTRPPGWKLMIATAQEAIEDLEARIEAQEIEREQERRESPADNSDDFGEESDAETDDSRPLSQSARKYRE